MNEAPPELASWDIADLSVLPVREETRASASAGPVRRRKASVRANPLGKHALPSVAQTAPVHGHRLFSNTHPGCPRTPDERTPPDPSSASFFNLMPIYPPHRWDDAGR